MTRRHLADGKGIAVGVTVRGVHGAHERCVHE